jgi:hypothetical protein
MAQFEIKPERAAERQSHWRLPGLIAFIGFLAVALFYLATEHSAHFFGALPWVLLSGCLLMHFFMHGGPGSGTPKRG